MKKHTAAQSQRGLSMVGWMIVLGVVTVFGSAGVKIIPAYMEFNTISGIISSTLNDSKISLQSELEIMSGIDRKFSINNVTVISGQDLVVKRENGSLAIAVDYEVRKNLFGSLDLVAVFKKEFSKESLR